MNRADFVLAHVFPGMGRLHAGERQAESTQSPADHGQVEKPTAVKVCKPR
jgi:hypothetical protein